MTWGDQIALLLEKMNLSQSDFIEQIAQQPEETQEIKQLIDIGIEIALELDKSQLSNYIRKPDLMPKRRARHLTLLWNLCQLKAILTVKEANDLLELAEQRPLKPNEIKALFNNENDPQVIESKPNIVSPELTPPFENADEKFQQSNETSPNEIQELWAKLRYFAQDLFPAVEERDNDRQEMLDQVASMWVDKVLEQALYSEQIIDLTIIHHPEFVYGNPWQDIVALPESAIFAHSDTSHIVELFDQAKGRLLILGEPGTGKSTMLLILARALLMRARKPSAPIPVVCNLVTWSREQKPIGEWIERELITKYFVRTNIAPKWVAQDQLVLLLDGLDEVSEEDRIRCCEALNDYLNAHPVQIAICCRINEFTKLGQKLCLIHAIEIQPLIEAQLFRYLHTLRLEKELSPYLILPEDASSQFMLSPLMVNTIIRTYDDGKNQGRLSRISLATTTVEFYSELFENYVEWMFTKHRIAVQHYPVITTKERLSWLAQKMIEQQINILYIEHLQPSWLTTKWIQIFYLFLTRLLIGLIGGVFGGIMVGLGGGVFNHEMQEGTLRGIIEGTIAGFGGGAAMGLMDITRIFFPIKIEQLRRFWKYNHPILRMASKIISRTILVGTLVWALIGILLGSMHWLGKSPTFWWTEGFFVGNLTGLSFGLMFGFRSLPATLILTKDISSVERLGWRFDQAITGSIYGVLAGLATSIFLLSFGDTNLPIMKAFPGNSLIVVAVAVCTYIGVIFGGVSGRVVHVTDLPNQGIWISLRSSIFLGGMILILCTIVGIIVGLFSPVEPWNYVSFGVYGIFVGVLAFLWYGGIDCIKHGILRLLLALEGNIPLNLCRFLDYGVDRIFLHRVGGGYRFIHNLLQTHFIALKKHPLK